MAVDDQLQQGKVSLLSVTSDRKVSEACSPPRELAAELDGIRRELRGADVVQLPPPQQQGHSGRLVYTVDDSAGNPSNSTHIFLSNTADHVARAYWASQLIDTVKNWSRMPECLAFGFAFRSIS